MWEKRTSKGVERFVGAIGDPLRIHVVAEFDEYLDLSDVVWLAQIRRRVPAVLTATLTLVDDSSVATPGEPGSTLIDLLFALDDTTMLADATRYVYGVKAIGGALAPYTLIAADPIYGYDVVPREE